MGDNSNGDRIFELERKRWALRVAVAIIAVEVIMYFVVQPIISAFGKHIDLPDWRLVFVLTCMAGAALWSFDLKDIAALWPRGISISIDRKKKEKDDAD